MLKSFNYLIDEKTHTLIIGTMPGKASLSAEQYYAHPQNAFWHIIADIFNQGERFKSYTDKTACLLANGVGLWDNLQYCEREGSLDSNIKNEYPNDFETLLQNKPHIKRLLFNGQKSFAFFKKYHKPLLQQVEWYIMPSTSPANATKNYLTKLNEWKQGLK